jgi:hypothetical protein
MRTTASSKSSSELEFSGTETARSRGRVISRRWRGQPSFEPTLRSDVVENRLLHLDLSDPRRVATRRAQDARRALLNLRGSLVPEPVYSLTRVTTPTVAPLERRLPACCGDAVRDRMSGAKPSQVFGHIPLIGGEG